MLTWKYILIAYYGNAHPCNWKARFSKWSKLLNDVICGSTEKHLFIPSSTDVPSHNWKKNLSVKKGNNEHKLIIIAKHKEVKDQLTFCSNACGPNKPF